jgi:hypothetical protein
LSFSTLNNSSPQPRREIETRAIQASRPRGRRPRNRPVTSGTAGQAQLVQKPPIDNTKPGEFKVSTIGKPVHAPRRILPVIFKVIDRTALFVAYAVFLAVLPVGAIGLLSRTV